MNASPLRAQIPPLVWGVLPFPCELVKPALPPVPPMGYKWSTSSSWVACVRSPGYSQDTYAMVTATQPEEVDTGRDSKSLRIVPPVVGTHSGAQVHSTNEVEENCRGRKWNHMAGDDGAL